MHTVSAPAGGGKTSFSYALIVAVTRYAESTPDAPHGCVFVVDEITKADMVYRDLKALLPADTVAIWTTEHDPACKRRERVPEDSPSFRPAELRHYPVIVVTSKFYLGTNGRHARAIVRDGDFDQRALTVVDERPEDVKTFLLSRTESKGGTTRGST
jgi:hypothetical protein